MKAGSWKALVVVGLFCLASTALSAQTFKDLISFGGSDGSAPGAIIQGANGSLYGITGGGGSTPYCTSGCGTIFEITPTGKILTLYNFCSEQKCVDGLSATGLMQASNGNLYGTTHLRGVNFGGTIFELTPSGQFTTLYNFCAQTNCTDGSRPVGTLVQGLNGKLYGLTENGGTSGFCQQGCGTMFQVTLSGQFTSVFSFCAKTDCVKEGRNPEAGLALAPNGNFYGTTYNGGSKQEGTIFTITPSGVLTKLYNFYSLPNGADGWGVQSPVTLGNDGNFYGTTTRGGANGGGSVFKITPAGQLTTVYSFCSAINCTDGSVPLVPVAPGSDGNFYGTTWAGGFSNDGVAFQVTPNGEYSMLYSFCSQANCKDGLLPNGGIMQATDGLFYGTTIYGGNPICGNGCGELYSISMGLQPYVQPKPAFAPVGRQIQILGNNLNGTTSVTFNGTPTTFKVVSGTFLTATVPAGATTGPIEVTTPTGTLSSNVAFQVIP
jgi:uncharacterized repeat protein (TIGR03803 family)